MCDSAKICRSLYLLFESQQTENHQSDADAEKWICIKRWRWFLKRYQFEVTPYVFNNPNLFQHSTMSRQIVLVKKVVIIIPEIWFDEDYLFYRFALLSLLCWVWLRLCLSTPSAPHSTTETSSEPHLSLFRRPTHTGTGWLPRSLPWGHTKYHLHLSCYFI